MKFKDFVNEAPSKKRKKDWTDDINTFISTLEGVTLSGNINVNAKVDPIIKKMEQLSKKIYRTQKIFNPCITGLKNEITKSKPDTNKIESLLNDCHDDLYEMMLKL